MAAEQFANDIQTTLSSGIDASQTSISVASSAGFPSSAQYRIRVGDELMLVTAGAGTSSWTVTRGVEGTTAASHLSAVDVVHVLTAAAIGGASDPVAGTPGLRSLGTGAQQAAAGSTLANKEDVANKSTDGTLASNSDTLYPSQKATKTYVDGAITTGIPASLFDAKGDLLAATADNTAARLPVGTNGQVLTAASGASAGVQWATVSSSGGGTIPQSLLTVYVDYVNGNDVNNGRSWDTPYKTIQAAYNGLVTYAVANYTVDANGRLGVGKISLAPGDHQVGAGLALDNRYAVEIVGTRSGRSNHDMGTSASRIVSTSTVATEMVRITHASAIGLGFVFRDIAFRVDDTATTGNVALTKVIWATKIGRLRVERCSFGTVGNSNSISVTAIYHEDLPSSSGEAGWVRILANDCSRMQLYKATTTTGAAGGNFNRGRIADNVVLYGALPNTLFFGPMIHLNANCNGYLVDGNNLEGSATGVELSTGTFTQNTFLNNSGEDQSATVPNPFYDVNGSCSQQMFIGGTVTALAGNNGTFVRFNNASAYNNMVIGPYDANGTTGAKRKIVDNSTSNGNVILHPNHRIAMKYEAGAGAAITDGDFTTGPPPNGTLGVTYDTTAAVASLFMRANNAWVRISPGGLTTKGDLSTYSTAPTRLGVGSNGQILTADSTAATGIKWAAPPAGTSAVDPVVRTSDSTHVNSGNTGATLTNDSVLLWPIAGNSSEIWFFECFLTFNSANATMDVKLGWSVPAGTTMLWGDGYTAGATTVPGFHSIPAGATALTAVYTAASTASFAGLVGAFLVGPSGFVYSGGTAGNINLQWAQNTADAGDLYLRAGSFIRLTKLVI